MIQPIIFVSYSHKDEREKERLLVHLEVLQHEGVIDIWSDNRIGAGADWEQEIIKAIARARVAILLVSANFLTSDFILGKEVPTLFKHHKNAGLTIFPVIAKACAWQAVNWLATMSVRPKNGRPIWGINSRRIDEDLAAIAKEISVIINTGPSTTLTSSAYTDFEGTEKKPIQDIYELFSEKYIRPADCDKALSDLSDIEQNLQYLLNNNLPLWYSINEQINSLASEIKGFRSICLEMTPRVQKQRQEILHKIKKLLQDLRAGIQPTAQSIPSLESFEIKFNPQETSQSKLNKFIKSFVSLLLECSCIKDRKSREVTLGMVRSEITTRIQRHDTDVVDVNNIVVKCLEFSDGLNELVDAVRYFEGNSRPMQNIDSFLKMSPLSLGL